MKSCCLAIEAMKHLVIGLELDWVKENPGRFWHFITGDSQLRWIGPDKGAMHLATGAVVNAVWDLLAKEAKKPVWQLVGEMTPEEIVNIVDFRYLTDVLTRDEALGNSAQGGGGQAGADRDSESERLSLLYNVGRLARLFG